jgi:hypothetical protein
MSLVLDGTAGVTTPAIVNTGTVSAAGTSTNSALPSFFANLSATATNVTGDGTAYTIICNTELFDRASNYNNATGVFTAPITGIYQFNATAFITDIQSTQNNFDIYLQATARNYHGSGNATALITFQNLILNFSGLIPLTSGDTVSMVVSVVGGTKTADVLGSSTPYTHFSGFLVA